MTAQTLPAGTRVEARITTATGSRISYAGDRIEATVIAPVLEEGRLLIPQGASVSGAVQRVDRVGLGLKHLTSAIEYRFDTVQWPGAAAIPIETRVVRVETAKEQVNAKGVIGGIYPTANLSSSVSFYALPLLCVHPDLAVPMLGIKVLIARSPDPEIYFPAGTEVIFELTAATEIPNPGAPLHHIESLSAAETAEAERELAKLPEQHTDRGRNHPSDLINILIFGSRQSIDRAFRAAGWFGAQRNSMMSIYGMYHCMVQRMGYRMAPMGNLTLNGAMADAEYQKSLDTFSKRHHVRLWKQGREDVWLSATTEDVGYKFWRMHLTHATDPVIDNERAKVLNDLAFTGCLEAASFISRDSSGSGQRAHSISTDGKVAVLQMNECANPRTMPESDITSARGGRRRPAAALLALRNDVIRMNPVSLAYNTVGAIREHERSEANARVSGFNTQSRWIRRSVLDAVAARNATADLSVPTTEAAAGGSTITARQPQ